MKSLTDASWTRLALLVALLGVAVRVPEVAGPFKFDDLYQYAYLADHGENPFSFRNGLDLFRFFDGDADAARAKMSSGALPWRHDENAKAAFFRPLASATMVLDHALFGTASVPAKIHSFLWFLLFLLGVRRIYTYLLTPKAAAQRLSLAESTVFQLLTSGRLESITIGRARRIPMDALLAYIDRLRREQE